MFYIKNIAKRFKNQKVTIILLICGFMICMLLISLGTNFFNELKKQDNVYMEHKPLNIMRYSLDYKKNTDVKKLIKSIESIQDNAFGIMLEGNRINIDKNDMNSYYDTNLIWFNDETLCSYPISNGNWFTQKELQNDERVAVVGKYLLDYAVTENAKKYLTVGNEKYRIIGTVGIDRKSSPWDGMLFLPLKRASQDIKAFGLNTDIDNISIFGKKPYEDNFQLLRESLRKYYPQLAVTGTREYIRKSMEYFLFENTDSIISMTIYLYIMSLLLSVFITYYWIQNIKKEIGIRKTFGYTNFTISKIVFSEYLIIVFLAFVLSTLVQTVLGVFIDKVVDYPINLSFISLVSSLIIVVISGIIISILPIIKAIHVSPIKTINS